MHTFKMLFQRIICNNIIRNQNLRLFQSPCLPRKRTILSFGYLPRAEDQTRSISVCSCHYAIKDSNVRTENPNTKSNDNLDEPLRYSTSKATKWTVVDSFQLKEKQQNPIWRTVTISGVLLVVLAWVFLRKESNIDKVLEKDLYQQWEEKYPNFKATGKDKEL